MSMKKIKSEKDIYQLLEKYNKDKVFYIRLERPKYYLVQFSFDLEMYEPTCRLDLKKYLTTQKKKYSFRYKTTESNERVWGRKYNRGYKEYLEVELFIYK